MDGNLTRLCTESVFIKRSQILKEIRNFLADRDFMEVETPMLVSNAGGAAARPFETHYNALNEDSKASYLTRNYILEETDRWWSGRGVTKVGRSYVTVNGRVWYYRQRIRSLLLSGVVSTESNTEVYGGRNEVGT